MSDVPMPPDVLAQILSWLPVSSLLRFRSVSKSFRALIDSDYVISNHYNNSVQSNSSVNLIFGGDRSLHYLNLDTSDRYANVVNKIHNPLYFAIFETVILGSCNGIVCLCTTEPDNEIAFWNPVVRKFKKTRLSPAKCLEGVGRGVCVKGFGYDHVRDDFKVVRLVQYVGLFKELVYSKIEVFSLKTEAWRETGDFNYHVCNRRYLNVYVNGCLHWLVSEKAEVKDELMIAAFDLTTEAVRFVPKPEFVNEKAQVNLGILGGCLCMVCNYPKVNVDIWVMKRYGVKDSWSKLISTEDVKIIRELDMLRPIVYSKNGREVLLEKNFERLYWYHLEDKTAKRFKVAGMPRLFVTEMFTGSLVQVKLGNASRNVTNKDKNDDKNRKKKDDFLSKGFRLVL
ncbi:putative F-box domain-containing protein [Helianthus annuus]|nr:putative F-box domain-containing protein [Helianthus annuus]KAJ0696872.1 putative F-box domain-containing protein [Helianthus annuus]KAJ0700312.1 putative F-box domain-containing protein [Helianthus annuus]KAJ0743776.1 putative F-box domain-containing protein [Helianthus annuus]KAJ0879615.1 putative F-box domain-containing protein [Helianthus annuus]